MWLIPPLKYHNSHNWWCNKSPRKDQWRDKRSLLMRLEKLLRRLRPELLQAPLQTVKMNSSNKDKEQFIKLRRRARSTQRRSISTHMPRQIQKLKQRPIPNLRLRYSKRSNRNSRSRLPWTLNFWVKLWSRGTLRVRMLNSKLFRSRRAIRSHNPSSKSL